MDFGLMSPEALLWDPFSGGAFFSVLLTIGFLGVIGLALTAGLILPVRGVFLIISSLFDRFTSEADGVFESCEYVLNELAGSQGGTFYQSSPNCLDYSPQSNTRVTVKRFADTTLSIRVYENFPFRGIFLRLPRILQARLPRFSYLLFTRNSLLRDLSKRSGFRSLAKFLYQSRFSIRFDAHGLLIKKRLQAGEVLERTFLNLINVAGDVATIASTFVSIRISNLSGNIQCAFCKELLTHGASVVVCFSCGTPHHRDCFELNGSCSLFGCDSKEISAQQEHAAAYLQ